MENPQFQRASFDAALVMVRHIVEVCADDQLARHIYRQLEREAQKARERIAKKAAESSESVVK
jgi:rRNA processing protein Krr1/Pno1